MYTTEAITYLDGLETIILSLYRTDKPLNADGVAPRLLTGASRHFLVKDSGVVLVS